jgi:hypothetical protein
MLILLFNNSNQPKITASMLKTPYHTEISESLNFTFEYVDLDKAKNPNNIPMSTNLLMFLTSENTFEKDIEKLRSMISSYPAYSRLNIMIMIYSKSYATFQNLEAKIQKDFKDDLAV